MSALFTLLALATLAITGIGRRDGPRQGWRPPDPWRGGRVRRRQDAVWQAFADRHGLELSRDRRTGLSLAGQFGDIDVEIRVPVMHRRGLPEASLSCSPGPLGFDIEPRRRRGPAPSCVTGDEAFDAVASIVGSSQAARARLDAATRRLVMDVIAASGAVRDDRVTLPVPEVGEAARIGDLAYRAAQALRLAPHEEPEALARLVKDEPDPEVRSSALHELASFLGDVPWVRPAFEHAAQDLDDPWCAGVAAWHLRRADVLVQLVDPATHPPGVVLGALRALRGGWAPEREVQALKVAARSTDPVIWSEVLVRARALPAEVTPDILLQVVRFGLGADAWRRLSRPTRSKARSLLTEVGRLLPSPLSPGHETALVALAEHPDDPLARQALSMLAARGSLRAVEDLTALEARTLAVWGRRRDVRAAITSIQGRAGPADRGRVSLVDAPLQGAVSLTEAQERGRLGLAARQASRQSSR